MPPAPLPPCFSHVLLPVTCCIQVTWFCFLAVRDLESKIHDLMFDIGTTPVMQPTADAGQTASNGLQPGAIEPTTQPEPVRPTATPPAAPRAVRTLGGGARTLGVSEGSSSSDRTLGGGGVGGGSEPAPQTNVGVATQGGSAPCPVR